MCVGRESRGVFVELAPEKGKGFAVPARPLGQFPQMAFFSPGTPPGQSATFKAICP
jgi:hypothetical protein